MTYIQHKIMARSTNYDRLTESQVCTCCYTRGDNIGTVTNNRIKV